MEKYNNQRKKITDCKPEKTIDLDSYSSKLKVRKEQNYDIAQNALQREWGNIPFGN